MDKVRKTDRRTIYTKQRIIDAYLDLLERKPREKIKVTEVCQIAEISRCTFYLHFQDVPAIGETIENSIIEQFVEFIDSSSADKENAQLYSNKTYAALLNDETFCRLVRCGAHHSIMEKVNEYAYQTYPVNPKLTPQQAKLLYIFISGGMQAIHVNWVKEGVKDIKKDNIFLDKIVGLLNSIHNQERAKRYLYELDQLSIETK